MEETKQWLVKVSFKSFKAKVIAFAQDLSLCNGLVRSNFQCFAMGIRFSWSSILIASCVHVCVNSITSHSRLSGHRRVCVCARDPHLGDISLALAHASLSTSPFFASRAAWLLVIGCVGGIMTLGGGRRQQSMKQNTAWCAAPGTLWFLRSALHLSKMSESVRRKRSNITAHCPRLCGVRCHSLYNLPHGELL